jgi:ATP-dependent DNA helicase RecQ
MERTAEEAGTGEAGAGVGTGAGTGVETQDVLAAQIELLRHMQGMCGTLACRHRTLARYFGQTYDRASCGACDVCLEEVEPMAGSTVVAQKILSCVARLEGRWGVGHVVDVLRGAATDNVRRCGHDRLSTFALLRQEPEKALTNLVYQLVDQGLLDRSSGDRPILRLTPEARPVLRGEREVRLVRPGGGRVRRSEVEGEAWEGVDRGLFEHLRGLRLEMARARSVPPYVLFSDRVLRGLARARPSSLESMRGLWGIGERKLDELGGPFTEAIRSYCAEHGIAMDAG